MFQTGGERCPVALFRKYLSRRPQTLQRSGPFYLSVKSNRRANDEIWYKVQPMGVNKINSMMKDIIAGTSLETSEKRFSNHSARKTVVNQMKKANLERSAIAKVTGHRNIQSLNDYDEADEDEQRDLSWAISKRNRQGEQNPATSSITSAMIPHMSSQAHTLMNSYSKCQVTFNLNNKTSPVIKQRKRRFHFLDSDSDTD